MPSLPKRLHNAFVQAFATGTLEGDWAPSRAGERSLYAAWRHCVRTARGEAEISADISLNGFLSVLNGT